jgi:hypothetical protein
MKRSLPTSLLVLLAASLALGACKKEEPTTPPDDGGTGGVTEPEPEGGGEQIPPQDPDPAELAANLEAYELGKYEEVGNALTPLVESWTGDTQMRMNAIGSAILALALTEGLAENAKAPSERAVSLAEKLGDDEVEQYARIAHGAYLLGVEDATGALEELDKAVALDGPRTELAKLFLAEATLNLAFDAEGKITDKAKLDEAGALYQEVADGASSDIVKAHALEGLAGAHKYKGERDKVCEPAKAAADLYESAGASDYVKEVPSILLSEAKCK